jgi:hypothetical protein
VKQALSLEDMSAKFNSSLREYGMKKLERLNPLSRKGEVAANQMINVPPVAEGGTNAPPVAVGGT